MAQDEAHGGLSGYQDFTVATAFERFAASIESCVTTWSTRRDLAEHRILQAQLQHRFPWRTEPYTLVLHLPPPPPALPPRQQAECHQRGGQLRPAASSPLVYASGLRDTPHRLQHWFGVRAFLLLTPDSYSGRVLDAEEANTLLSAAAVALSHARITWPLLLPVHDAVRDGYRGVAVATAAAGGATLHLDTDSGHSSRLPAGLLQLEQQLLLFAKQLGAAGAPAAAAACRAAAGAELDGAHASMAAAAAAAGAQACADGSEAQHVALAVRHCYALPDVADSGGEKGGGTGSGEWDELAPWRPWAAQADPIGCLELDVVWRVPSAATTVQAAAAAREMRPPEEAADVEAASLAPADAADWRLLALSTSYERDRGHRGFVLRPVDKPRRCLRLQSLLGQHAQRIIGGSADVAPDQLPGDASFYGMLLKLLESCTWAAQAPSLGDLASSDWWLRQGSYQPRLEPDWVLHEAVRDVFQLDVLPVWPAFPPGTVAWPTSMAGQHGFLGKAAPLGALISRFALHALALGSPRSVAELWSRFVGTLRLQYWEHLEPLPRMRLQQELQEQERQQQEQEQQERQQQEQEQQEQEQHRQREQQFQQHQEEQQQQQHEQLQAGHADANGSAAAAAEAAGAGAGPAACSSGGASEAARPDPPDFRLSLLHQKLQLLDVCIHMLREQRAQQASGGRSGTPPARAGKRAAAAVAAAGAAAAEGNGWGWDSSEEMEGEEGLGDEQPVSPGSSSDSSYFSARNGSEAQLSPSRSQQQQQQQQVVVEAAGITDDAAAACEGPGLGAAERGEQPADGAAGSGCGEPRGAVGVMPSAFLHLHPDRPLRVPAVQEPPAQTEDLAAERLAAQQVLPSGQDASALRSQLQGRMLTSDMQAFKAANPGCCLLDFVRWHSPKDCISAPGGSCQLSKRMATEGNAWQQLWGSAAPVPAARQRPLLDPQLEGERALHFLETLPPPALFSELLAVGYSAAVQVLGTAGAAAELAAVQHQLACLSAEASAELACGVAAITLGDGSVQQTGAAVAASAAPVPADQQRGAEGEGWEEEEEGWEEEEEGEEQAGLGALGSGGKGGGGIPRWVQRQPSWLSSIFAAGLESARYRRLLLLLGCAEQVVVGAHSLLLRLGWRERQLGGGSRRQGPQSGMTGGFAASAAGALIAAALGDAQPEEWGQASMEATATVAAGAVVSLPHEHRPAAEALVVQRWADEEEEGSDSEASQDSGGGGAGEWPQPFQREWLLQVQPGPDPGDGAAVGWCGGSGGGSVSPVEAGQPEGAGPRPVPAVLQRMYLKALPSEVRIATVLSSEFCSR